MSESFTHSKEWVKLSLLPDIYVFLKKINILA